MKEEILESEKQCGKLRMMLRASEENEQKIREMEQKLRRQLSEIGESRRAEIEFMEKNSRQHAEVIWFLQLFRLLVSRVVSMGHCERPGGRSTVVVCPTARLGRQRLDVTWHRSRVPNPIPVAIPVDRHSPR